MRGRQRTDEKEYQTFNSLFQSGTYSGRANVLGPDNAIRLEPSLGLFFSERVTLREIYRGPKSWAEQTHLNLIYWNEAEHGGHFAAFEQPDIFVEECVPGFEN